MEYLYPVDSAPSGDGAAASDKSDSVSVIVNCRIPSAEQKNFLNTLHRLLNKFARFEGTCGASAFKCEKDGHAEISILQRFENKAAHEAWLLSPEFAEWRTAIAPPTHVDNHVQRYTGMEPLFVTAAAPDAPPRWKMAILLMIAVYPMSVLISVFFAPALATLPMLLGPLLTSVVMVWLMTYVLVPVLAKIFQRWLSPKKSSGRS